MKARMREPHQVFLKRLVNLPKLSGLHDSANVFEAEADSGT
jgi:hypothetical protein